MVNNGDVEQRDSLTLGVLPSWCPDDDRPRVVKRGTPHGTQAHLLPNRYEATTEEWDCKVDYMRNITEGAPPTELGSHTNGRCVPRSKGSLVVSILLLVRPSDDVCQTYNRETRRFGVEIGPVVTRLPALWRSLGHLVRKQVSGPVRVPETSWRGTPSSSVFPISETCKSYLSGWYSCYKESLYKYQRTFTISCVNCTYKSTGRVSFSMRSFKSLVEEISVWKSYFWWVELGGLVYQHLTGETREISTTRGWYN